MMVTIKMVAMMVMVIIMATLLGDTSSSPHRFDYTQLNLSVLLCDVLCCFCLRSYVHTSSLFSPSSISSSFFIPFFFSTLISNPTTFIPHKTHIPYIATLYRHLKFMYFTVLERFSREELLSQVEALSCLEADLLSDTKAKSRRRTLRNQKDRIHARLKELELENPDGSEGFEFVRRDDDMNDVLNHGLVGLDTDVHIAHLSSTTPSSSSARTTIIVHSNTTSSSLHLHEVSHADLQSSSPLDISLQTQLNSIKFENSGRLKEEREEENTENTRHERTLDPLIPHRENLNPHYPNLVSVTSDSSIPLNPKTRLGWGFWQT